MSVDLRGTDAARWPDDYDLGDLVTVRVDGQTLVKRIEEIVVTVDGDGERVRPKAGGGDPDQRVRFLERLGELEADASRRDREDGGLSKEAGDARWVNRDGDTIRDDDQSAVFPLELESVDEDDVEQRIEWFLAATGHMAMRALLDGVEVGRVEFRVQDRDELLRLLGADVEITGDLDVDGSKNSRIADPDDPTKAFRFAAVEADEPGLLMHRAAVTVGTGGQATVDLPEHWSRIARDADAWAIPRSGEPSRRTGARGREPTWTSMPPR